ncbi:MAG: endonuclease/exonuclease/phosphatase family protein [Burkholderiales bacterium]|nr:endonuclease/exonuclease/phosphatase family protein [Burkholderiales bacterium]
MQLRIATYNIHKGVSTLGSQPRVHALKEAIHALDAQLIFLQEVQGRHDKHALRYGEPTRGHKHWPEQAQHEFLAGEHLHVAYGKNATYQHGHHGNALLSTYPIAKAYNRDVSDHAFEQRGILHCCLQTPKQTLHCYVVHLGLFAGSRERQTEALIEVVNQTAPSDAPLIIAGDFNDWRNQLGTQLRQRLGVIEVFDERRSGTRLGAAWRKLANRNAAPRLIPARTFPAALPWLRLDRIYVRGFRVEQAQVLHGPMWAKLSDHAPIVAQLELTL